MSWSDLMAPPLVVVGLLAGAAGAGAAVLLLLLLVPVFIRIRNRDAEHVLGDAGGLLHSTTIDVTRKQTAGGPTGFIQPLIASSAGATLSRVVALLP